jgi:hypothetical protein
MKRGDIKVPSQQSEKAEDPRAAAILREAVLEAAAKVPQETWARLAFVVVRDSAQFYMPNLSSGISQKLQEAIIEYLEKRGL